MLVVLGTLGALTVWGVSHWQSSRDVSVAAVTGTIAAFDASTGSLVLDAADSRQILRVARSARIVRGSRLLSPDVLGASVGERAKVTFRTRDGTPTADEIRLPTTFESELTSGRATPDDLPDPSLRTAPDQDERGGRPSPDR